MMIIGKSLLTINLMLGIAVRMPVTRPALYKAFNKKESAAWSEFFTFFTLFSTAGIAIVFPDIYSALTIIGGLGGISIAYLFPGKSERT